MAHLHVPALLALVTALSLYFYRAVSINRRRKGAKPPPGPRGLPILGNALDLARDPHLIPTFNKWNKQFGPVVRINVLGQERVIISSERIANDLLSKRGNIYSDRGTPPALKVITDPLSSVALADKTETWRRQRKLLHNVMSVTENVRYEPCMDLESKYTLLDLLQTPANFDDHLGRYTFGVLIRSGFGLPTKSLQDPLVLEIDDQNVFLGNCFRPDKYYSNLAPWLLKLPRWLCSEFAELDAYRAKIETLTLNWQNALQVRMRKGEVAAACLQRVFLDNPQEYGLSPLAGGSVFREMLGAGSRSPHNALLEFLMCMLQHSEWLRKLQVEVDRVVGPDRLPAFADMPSLPTVRAVVKEGVRCRSVKAEIALPHKLSQDDVYEGYFFPAGTIFHPNVSAMLTDPTLYPDGDTFNPARWLEPSYPTFQEPLTIHPNLQNFAAFGFGRRVCPGTNFAERSLTLMVARIAWACDIEPAADPQSGKAFDYGNVQYEPIANPRPLPFPAVLKAKSRQKTELVRRDVERARNSDALLGLS